MKPGWSPPIALSDLEERILKLCSKQKLWRFLREYRHVLFDDEVRSELAAMYSDSGRGSPVCPERLALAMVLQIAFDVADHEVPTLTAVDRRWRMVLDALGEEDDEPLFSQGSVFHFRERAREHGFMKLLLEKTITVARETKGFSHKRLRAMVDSSPLIGAGRVEDTFNLIGRALCSLVSVVAKESGRSEQDLAGELALTVVSAKSIKAALDVDWRLPDARNAALNALLDQVSRLMCWLEANLSAEEVGRPPLSDAIALVEKLIAQDTEPDPDSPTTSTRRVKSGGSDRQVSIHDPDQRHGRKSKTKLFVGYKRHISTDADIPGLVVSVRVEPANVREHSAARPLLEDADSQGFTITELHIDRGYLPANSVHERRRDGMRVVSKPPTPARNRKRLGKADFDIDAANGTVTCSAGHAVDTQPTKAGPTAAFPRSRCRACVLASQCLPPSGQKKIVLHPNEAFFQEMAAELSTREGRAARRARVAVEHTLGRLGAIQGRKARYRGLAKNQAHAEGCAVVANCYALDRALATAA